MRSPKGSTRSLPMQASNGASRDARCVLPPTAKRLRPASARSRPQTAILSAARARGRAPIWQARPVRPQPRSPAPSPTSERWGADMPKPFNTLTAAIAAPIMRGNVDTDVIIRIERLVGNSIRGTLGKWAFGALRYLPDGSENPEFILNREPYRQGGNLLTRPEFGRGSSPGGGGGALPEKGICGGFWP